MIEAQFKIWEIEQSERNADLAELIKRLHASEQEVRRLKAENEHLKAEIYDLERELKKMRKTAEMCPHCTNAGGLRDD